MDTNMQSSTPSDVPKEQLPNTIPAGKLRAGDRIKISGGKVEYIPMTDFREQHRTAYNKAFNRDPAYVLTFQEQEVIEYILQTVTAAEVALLEKMQEDFSGEHQNMAVTSFVQIQLQGYIDAEINQRKEAE